MQEQTLFEDLTLENAAQTLMDLYYKDLAPEDAFYQLDIFIYVCRAAWGKLLDEECRQWRATAKQETGFYTIDLGADWLIQEEQKIEKLGTDKAVVELDDLPYGFAFDKWSYGIQSISSECIDTSVFERMTFDTEWKKKHLPKTQKKFWYPVKNRIVFLDNCNVGETVIVNYLPSMTKEKGASLPVGKLADILALGFQVMKQTFSIVVDKTNNSNPNTVVQNEIDNVFAQMRTKQG